MSYADRHGPIGVAGIGREQADPIYLHPGQRDRDGDVEDRVTVETRLT